MNDEHRRGLSYRDAGVDIERGAQLVERIRPAVAATERPGVMGTIGGFGGLFDAAAAGLRDPLLVSSTDGVGTKLLLAIACDHHATVGVDLVAMCVNDVLAHGATPLFFLDYFATSKLELVTAEAVIAGIARACTEAGAALLGGETAEMPDMYAPGHYDLAGFCVGAVERQRLIDGSKVRDGDVLLGIGANGVHANGYALVRRILAQSNTPLDRPFVGGTIGEILLEPTRIYVQAVLATLARVEMHALAHVTGGGLTENLPRVIPAGLAATIDLAAWRLPPIFDWLRREGGVARDEMLRTFNCGIGMVAVLAPDDVAQATNSLEQRGEIVYEIGHITRGAGEVAFRGELNS